MNILIIIIQIFFVQLYDSIFAQFIRALYAVYFCTIHMSLFIQIFLYNSYESIRANVFITTISL